MQPFPSTLNEDGTPNWDNPSMDGSQHNIGYYLNGTGGPFAEPGPAITPDWWGNPDGSADPDFYFTALGDDFDAHLRLEVAGLRDTNEFGWYDITTPAVLHPLFLGPDSPAVVVSFSPTGNFGFYLKAGDTETFYTQSALNSAGEAGTQHFVVFAESLAPGHSAFWIGAEDLIACRRSIEGSGDFNDIVVRVSETPEPSTWTMLGLGLLAAVIARIRRPAR